MNQFPFLTLLTLVPLVGGALVLAPGREHGKTVRFMAPAIAFLVLALAATLSLFFDRTQNGMQFVERAAWAPSLGIQYHLGVDGLGLLMVLLSALVIPFALLSSSAPVANPRLYYSLFLFLEAGLFGTFTAQNFVHWFAFWELSLIPAFFLIKIWGGPRRTAAAVQFFVYTTAGSVAMLIVFVALYNATGSFEFSQIAETVRDGRLGRAALPIFLGVFLGFAVKTRLLPFLTWLPDAYAEAPTGVSMVLTGAM